MQSPYSYRSRARVPAVACSRLCVCVWGLEAGTGWPCYCGLEWSPSPPKRQQSPEQRTVVAFCL